MDFGQAGRTKPLEVRRIAALMSGCAFHAAATRKQCMVGCAKHAHRPQTPIKMPVNSESFRGTISFFMFLVFLKQVVAPGHYIHCRY
jgi:hypothetical protein